jgi:hypothetical protein
MLTELERKYAVDFSVDPSAQLISILTDLLYVNGQRNHDELKKQIDFKQLLQLGLYELCHIDTEPTDAVVRLAEFFSLLTWSGSSAT